MKNNMQGSLFENDEIEDLDAKELNELDGRFAQKVVTFRLKQAWEYERKIAYAKQLCFEFYDKVTQEMNANVHVSVGGLDSLTLYFFLKNVCELDVKAVGVRSLEDRSIQEIHKAIGIEEIKPYKSKVQALNELGFPVISKEKATKIYTINHPTEKNATVRHAIITGECGEQGHFAKNSRMKLPQKWLDLFCGKANEEYGTNYKIAPFEVSADCCYWMKEKPCGDWAAEHNSYSYLGLMASEGGRREKALIKNGCNYFGKTAIRSCPFAIFTRQDLLRLAIELKVPVPSIYGVIETLSDGTLRTTKAQRTGCAMCGFGIHLDKRPHHFDQLREENPKEWAFWMYNCVTDKKTGEKYGWGKVLDYIGVEWENKIGQHINQTSMWEGEE